MPLPLLAVPALTAASGALTAGSLFGGLSLGGLLMKALPTILSMALSPSGAINGARDDVMRRQMDEMERSAQENSARARKLAQEADPNKVQHEAQIAGDQIAQKMGDQGAQTLEAAAAYDTGKKGAPTVVAAEGRRLSAPSKQAQATADKAFAQALGRGSNAQTWSRTAEDTARTNDLAARDAQNTFRMTPGYLNDVSNPADYWQSYASDAVKLGGPLAVGLGKNLLQGAFAPSAPSAATATWLDGGPARGMSLDRLF